jgi:hypothetical protein
MGPTADLDALKNTNSISSAGSPDVQPVVLSPYQIIYSNSPSPYIFVEEFLGISSQYTKEFTSWRTLVVVLFIFVYRTLVRKKKEIRNWRGGERVKLMLRLFSCGFGVKLPGLRVVFSSCSHLC